MNWDNIKCFIVTARAGALTQAANLLRMSPATLSRRLANLEHECGKLLFARTPTGYNLTAEGKLMLERCALIEKGFASLNSALEMTSKQPSGRVRLAVSENIANLVLLPKLPEFRNAFPLIEIEFRTGVHPIALHTREADIAVRASMPESGAFKARTVGTLHHGLYLSRNVDRNGAGNGLGIIGWSENSEGLPITRAAMAHSHWRSPTVRLNTLQGHVAAALAGLGYAYLPCFVGDQYQDLVRVEGPTGLLRHDIYMILHDDSIEMPKIRAVADFIISSMNGAKELFAGS